MNKKDKFYVLIFIFSILSLLISIILKILGFDLFYINIELTKLPNIYDAILRFLILSMQLVLMVGCVIRYKFKKLILKVIPYTPILICLYFLPDKLYSLFSILIIFVTCFTLAPKFSTIIRFIVNIFIISLIQIFLIWLKFDIMNIGPVFPDAIKLFIANIDQFIILTFAYYINMKRGEKYGINIFRRKKEKNIF